MGCTKRENPKVPQWPQTPPQGLTTNASRGQSCPTAEFQEMRQKGLKVKGYWFKFRVRQLLAEKEPGSSFRSDGLIKTRQCTTSASGEQQTLLGHQPVTNSPSSASSLRQKLSPKMLLSQTLDGSHLPRSPTCTRLLCLLLSLVERPMQTQVTGLCGSMVEHLDKTSDSVLCS